MPSVPNGFKRTLVNGCGALPRLLLMPQKPPVEFSIAHVGIAIAPFFFDG